MNLKADCLKYYNLYVEYRDKYAQLLKENRVLQFKYDQAHEDLIKYSNWTNNQDRKEFEAALEEKSIGE